MFTIWAGGGSQAMKIWDIYEGYLVCPIYKN